MRIITPKTNLNPGLKLVIVILAIMAFAGFTNGATITVTNTDDSGPGSLRQATLDASGGDTIHYAVTGTITLTTDELTVNKNVAIKMQ